MSWQPWLWWVRKVGKIYYLVSQRLVSTWTSWHDAPTSQHLIYLPWSIRYPPCLATRVEALAGLNSLNGNQDGGDHKHGEVPRSLQSTWRMSLLCTMCLGHNDCMALRATTWWKDMKWLEILTYFNKFKTILAQPIRGSNWFDDIWLLSNLSLFRWVPGPRWGKCFLKDQHLGLWRRNPTLGGIGMSWAVIFIHFLYD